MKKSKKQNVEEKFDKIAKGVNKMIKGVDKIVEDLDKMDKGVDKIIKEQEMKDDVTIQKLPGGRSFKK